MRTPQPDQAPAPSELAILGEGCPVRRVLRLIGDKWTPIVLYCLSGGVWRYGDLQRRIPDISKKMLTQVLRELETAGLAERIVHLAPSPKTEYRLTDAGRRLHETTAMLCHWANHNVDLLDAIEATGNRAEMPGE